MSLSQNIGFITCVFSLIGSEFNILVLSILIPISYEVQLYVGVFFRNGFFCLGI